MRFLRAATRLLRAFRWALLPAIAAYCAAPLAAQCSGLLGTPSPASPLGVAASGVATTLSFGLNGFCPWGVQTAAAFISLSPPASGIGSAGVTVAFTVATNPGAARQGSITVTINQVQVYVLQVNQAGADTTPPSVPANLTATPASASQINLTWSASTDNVGVAGYQVFRGGSLVGTTSSVAFSDTGLAPATTYTYTVAAFDGAANASAQSAPVAATTAGLAPQIISFVANPGSVAANQSTTLSWSVSGNPAPTLTINNGVGNVSGLSNVAVSPPSTMTYTLTATNSAGTASAQVTVTVLIDTTPPSVPSNVFGAAVSPFRISLFWTASTDNIGVAGYRIYRNGGLVGTSAATTYSDTGLSPLTPYLYTVAAFDAAGNQSPQSAAVSVTTQAELPAVAVFVATPATIVAGQVTTLSWSVSGTPEPALTISNGVGAVTGRTSITVTPAVTTTYTLSASNSAGTANAILIVTVIPDRTPPSVPKNLTASVVSTSQINLSWTPSSDDVGVTGYRVYRDGGQIGTSISAAYSDTLVSPLTAYSYTVAAFDAAGNLSSPSAAALATTAGLAPAIASFTVTPTTIAPGQQATLSWSVTGAPAPALTIDPGVGAVTGRSSISVSPQSTTAYQLTATNSVGAQTARVTLTVGADTTQPTVPANLTATAVSGSRINLQWTSSTDNVGVAGYRVYRDGLQVATPATTSYSDTGLAAGTTYTYTVAAYDAAGNVSAQSASAAATTAALAPTIVSFVASPPAVLPGQPTTLSWSVSGTPAPALSINNGVGAVNDRSSISVSPTITTTYQLTAANSAGSVSASATVTVSAPLPTLTSIVPDTFIQGTSVTATFRGTNFVTGAAVLSRIGGLTVTNITVVSPYEITAVISTSPSALAGPSELFINTVGGATQPIPIAVVSAPVVTLTGLQITVVPTQAATVGVSLAAPAPDQVDGRLTLSFQPVGAKGVGDGYIDPALQFAAGGTTLAFTIPKGASVAALPGGGAIQQGTVAGNINVVLTKLDMIGISVLPSSTTSGMLVVGSGPPVIVSGTVRIVDVSAGGFAVELTGYSTVRELTSATLQFSPANGAKLSGDTSFTIPLGSIATPWFDSDTGRLNGSRFSLRIPFSLSGDSTALGSATVTLSTSVQSSTAVSGGR